MSILIKGMEMPKDCGHCLLCEQDTIYEALVYRCLVTDSYLDDGCEHQIMKDCPLVPVPPHGRLINADALMREFDKAQRTMEQHGQEYSCSFMSDSRELSTEWYCVEDMLENAPTIIEAEEDE